MVGNLAASTQTALLDLREYLGATPSDLLMNEDLSPIAAEPYVLELPAYGYRWLMLQR
jgi:hypothetical protein